MQSSIVQDSTFKCLLCKEHFPEKLAVSTANTENLAFCPKCYETITLFLSVRNGIRNNRSYIHPVHKTIRHDTTIYDLILIADDYLKAEVKL